MKLRVKDTIYPAANIQAMTLLDTLELQAALRENPGISSARTMPDVLEFLAEFIALPRAEQLVHPEGLFLTCVTLWVTRRKSGERISFLDAIDITPDDYEWIRENSDPEPSAEGKVRAARSGSPARRAAADHLPKRRKTSKTP